MSRSACWQTVGVEYLPTEPSAHPLRILPEPHDSHSTQNTLWMVGLTGMHHQACFCCGGGDVGVFVSLLCDTEETGLPIELQPQTPRSHLLRQGLSL